MTFFIYNFVIIVTITGTMMRAVLKSVGSTTNRVITNKTKMNLSTLLCRSFTNNFAAYNNRTVNSRTVNLLTRSFSIADVLIDELQHETSAHKIEQDFVDIKNKISKSFAISDQDGIG